MKTTINRFDVEVVYTSTKHFNMNSITQWIWYYKPYTNIKGVIFRIFGFYFNIRELNATDKLINIANQRTSQD